MNTNKFGLHHVTAVAADAALSKHIFSHVLGLRLVKKSITPTDPRGYHLYFGDEFGSPGSLLTVMSPRCSKAGRIGAGQATIIQFSILVGTLEFWRSRLQRHNCQHILDETLFGDERALFLLPNGLLIALIENDGDKRKPWVSSDIGTAYAIRGLYGVTLAQQSTASLPDLLTDTFGYIQEDIEAVGATIQYRFRLPDADASVIDLQVDPNMARGFKGTGTIDHIGLYVGSDDEQRRLRQGLISAGLLASEIIDEQYTVSVSARTAGGLAIEVSRSKAGGFTVDENLKDLGNALCLPAGLEAQRKQIEGSLPKLD